MNAWLPQASYPYGNFSDTSIPAMLVDEGSLGPSFNSHLPTEQISQGSF